MLRRSEWKLDLYLPAAASLLDKARAGLCSTWTLFQVQTVLRQRLHLHNVIIKRPKIRGRRKYVGVYRGPEGREILFKISK